MDVTKRSAVDHGGSCGTVVLRSTMVFTVRFRMGGVTLFVLAPAVEIEDSFRQLPAQQ